MASDRWSGASRAAGIAFIIFASQLARSAQKVIEPWKVPCGDETIQPNLVLKSAKHLYGQLKDPTGAAFEKSKVILRRQTKKGEFLNDRVAVTDTNRRFDLKSVESGLYRVLPGRNRGWKQPKEVSCSESPECGIKLVLELSPTDQPFAQCPIK